MVDELQKENGGVATFFVRSGDEYVRASTKVIKDDGSLAIGTILPSKGKVRKSRSSGFISLAIRR